ncbi:Dihydroorotate dehydrogenase [Candidatus Anstonella stagnisolia]|nr:Dihydroorotate dehydrogenase [Candidatus Anstonella stagnisolia]
MGNPLVLASGIWGTSGLLLVRAAKSGAGAVTSKSCSLQPREGHKNPTIVLLDGYVLNAVGLSNPGAKTEVEELAEAKKGCLKEGVPVIASIFARSVEEFAQAAQIVMEAKPDAIELNMSCPNVGSEGRMFACVSEDAAKVVVAVKNVCSVPVFAKLTPNVTDIVEVAKAVEEAGADGIVAINTMPGMLIDAKARRPILSNREGGLSGAALKPIALRAVYSVSREVEIPIIGTGGVMSGLDAVEMLMAGASAVGVGSAISYRKNALGEIRDELFAFMKENGYSKISGLKLQE